MGPFAVAAQHSQEYRRGVSGEYQNGKFPKANRSSLWQDAGGLAPTAFEVTTAL
jgi:hypothetical protein